MVIVITSDIRYSDEERFCISLSNTEIIQVKIFINVILDG